MITKEEHDYLKQEIGNLKAKLEKLRRDKKKANKECKEAKDALEILRKRVIDIFIDFEESARSFEDLLED